MYVHGRKTGCRLSLDYTYRGLRVGFLENEWLRIGVLLDKGGDIFEFTYKPHDLDFLWHSPIDLRPQFVATNSLVEGHFHDYYHGGWQEVLPSAGWASEPYQGTVQGLHGELSLLPQDVRVIIDSSDEVAIEMSANLYRSPLRIVRTLTLRRGQPRLFIDERLTNLATVEFAVMWGHHPAFGEPFLSPDCHVETPAGQVTVMAYHANGLWQPDQSTAYPQALNRRTGKSQSVAQVLPKETGSVDVLAFKQLTAGWYAITNRKMRIGFAMAWDHELFPYLWMWQNYGGHTDYPWYGRAYCCALEPFTSFPPVGIAGAVRNGSAKMLAAGETIETRLTATAFQGSGVQSVSREGEVQI